VVDQVRTHPLATRTLLEPKHLRLGAVAAAEADARTAFETAEALLTDHEGAGELPELWPFTLLLDSRSRLRLVQRRIEEAAADALECGRRLEAWGVRNPAVMQWRATAASAMLASGDRAAALDLARDQLERAERFALPIATGIGLRALGVADGGAQGVETLRAAVAGLARTRASLEHARALTDLGAALRSRGRRRAAREPLRRALDLAARSSASALPDRAHSELVAAGARPRRSALEGAEALTASERRVAEMARDGLTNREIAQALFITEKTVEGHLSRTYSKLGVRSRARLDSALRNSPG
jgi:DNA-binding NarL/FixJ family response regulator